MNAICLVIDGLHAGYLGCYGNAWVGTPGCDRLAAESFVLDGAYLDSPALDSLYRSYWLGEHAAASSGRIENLSSGLADRLSAAGVSTTLATDAADVARHPLAGGFGQCVEVPTERPDHAASELEDTQAARFFAAGLDALREARPPFLLWLHSQGMAGPWDAPRELRERYAADDDPPPPGFTRPPAMRLPADPDPDELLGIRQAYAAQVAVLDSCVDALAEELRESKWAADTLFILLSARGYALGVHGCVGSPPGQTEPLYGELTSIPWLLRFPDGLGAADRGGALVQPPDLFATLLDWFGFPLAERADHNGLLPLVRGKTHTMRDRAAIVSPGVERALRTPAWYARFSSQEAAELYLKPDDRWEANDLSRRCPEVVEAMRKALDDCQTGPTPDGSPPAPLDEVLVHGMR
jgi:arylsulfatase A-like enzyme